MTVYEFFLIHEIKRPVEMVGELTKEEFGRLKGKLGEVD